MLSGAVFVYCLVLSISWNPLHGSNKSSWFVCMYSIGITHLSGKINHQIKRAKLYICCVGFFNWFQLNSHSMFNSTNTLKLHGIMCKGWWFKHGYNLLVRWDKERSCSQFRGAAGQSEGGTAVVYHGYSFCVRELYLHL